MSDPKSCPWCGHIDISVAEWSDGNMQMACDNCGATGPVMGTPDEAYVAWNARAGDTK